MQLKRLAAISIVVFCITISLRPKEVQPSKVVVFNNLEKSTKILNEFVEGSIFEWQNKLYYLVSERTMDGKDHLLSVIDFNSNKKISSFGQGLGLASVIVNSDSLYIFATQDWGIRGKSSIVQITTSDLKLYSKPKIVFTAGENQSIFNTSVTKNSDTNKFIMAIETDEDSLPAFNIRFLESTDLSSWKLVNSDIFGRNVYVACPSLRYVDGYYYMLYLRDRNINHECKDCISYIVNVARSKDLSEWEISSQDVLTPSKDEGINTSDPDIAEHLGKTILLYSVGDQAAWSNMKYATFNGPLKDFFSNYF